MQSVHQQQQDPKILEDLINQAFKELVFIWRDSDQKKKVLVMMMAERMEQLYTATGQEWKIEYISSEIKSRLTEAGITTNHHLQEYLDDKYKRAYEKGEKSPTGLIYHKYDLELVSRKNPLSEDLTKEECWWYLELYNKMAVISKSIEQAMEVRKIAKSPKENEGIEKKHFDKVTTDMPEPYKGRAYYVMRDEVIPAFQKLSDTHGEMLRDLERLPPKDQAQDDELADGLHHYATGILSIIDKFMGPFKDLKYATTIPNWWKIVKNFFAHGKHAAAVMDAIQSHKYMRDKTIKVNGISCPHNCGYYTTVPDLMLIPQADYALNPAAIDTQRKLIGEHYLDRHKSEIPKGENVRQHIVKILSNLKLGEYKTIIQVPLERNFTREQTGDQINELLELALAYTQAVPAFAALCNWRIDVHDPRVATRRIDANEKLSWFS